ncbi:ankyrin repeat domain-containing protein [Gemmatimonas sp.]|uniref:ankyrin repeat domain-containing protein n=1 Tax=Gemmatimonas sp. TaxID=1962908 RepID=UPI0039830279
MTSPHLPDSSPSATPIQQLHSAMQRGDADAARRLLAEHAEFRQLINAPFFAFNSPAMVAYANDVDMVNVLLEFGADPNRRSEWWAGAFHALHVATGAAAQRLLAAGAIPDACAAAHLDDANLLATMLAADPARASERGGDGQTPLHFARSRGVIDLLLNAGADINARDVDHRATPAEWMLAGARGAGRYELALDLVERGADVDIFLAAALGLTDRACTLLHREPALLNEQTGRGRYGEMLPSSFHIYLWSIGRDLSPLDVAAQFGHDDTRAAMQACATPGQ